MKAKDFKKFGKQLLPDLPGFAANKNLVFMTPIDDILRGVFFLSSTDANVFYFLVFFLPLFVPTDSVHGTYSKRLRRNGNQGWHGDDPNVVAHLLEAMHSDAMPFLNTISTLEGALNYLQVEVDSDRPRVNSHILEALAYTQIKCGDYASALKSLAELKQMLAQDTIPWVVEQRKRAELIDEKLLPKPEVALAQLETWKTETVSKLGLEKYLIR